MNHRLVNKAKKKYSSGRAISPKEHAMLIRSKRQLIKAKHAAMYAITMAMGGFRVATLSAIPGVDKLSKSLHIIGSIKDTAESIVNITRAKNNEL